MDHICATCAFYYQTLCEHTNQTKGNDWNNWNDWNDPELFGNNGCMFYVVIPCDHLGAMKPEKTRRIQNKIKVKNPRDRARFSM